MITIEGLHKSYGSQRAVTNLSFVARSGRITGLLGSNGSGKSTVLRILLGLIRADAGQAQIDGSAYRDLRRPLQRVGAMLDDAGAVPERRGRDHVRWVATSNGIGRDRVNEALQLVSLQDVATQPVRKYSLGMRQRLNLATALLGSPETLILDEPINGLDPEGIRWLRSFLRQYADAGNTVLLTSHFMAEMEQTADDLVLIANGVLVASGTVPEVTKGYSSLEAAYFGRIQGVLR